MKPDILLIEPMMSELEAKLDAAYTVHRLAEAKDSTGFIAHIAPSVRGIVNRPVMDALGRTLGVPQVLGRTVVHYPCGNSRCRRASMRRRR